MDEENKIVETGQAQAAVKSNSQGNRVVVYIILGGVAAFLLLMLLLAAIMAGMFESKKGAIKKALVNTFAESGKAIGEEWGFSDYLNLGIKDQGTVGLELNMAGMGSIDIQMVKNKDVFGGYLSVGYLGSSIRVADYYLDDEELRILVPMLSDSVFFIDRSTLNDDLDGLVEKGRVDEETAEYLKALNMGSVDAAEYYSGMNAANDKILQLVSDLYDEVEVKKISAGEFMVNGTQRKCKGYELKIINDQIADFYLGIRRICEEEPEYADYMRGILESGLGISLTGEPGEDDSLDQVLQETADYFREENYYINVEIYIYKDTVAHMQMDLAGKINVVWNVYGGNFPLENMELVASAENSGATAGEIFRLERGGSQEKDLYRADYRIVFDGDDAAIGLEYWKNNGDFSIEIGDDDASIEVEGGITKADSGKKLVIGLDTIAYDGEEILSGELTVSGEAEEIEKPEGDMVNLLEQFLQLPDYGSYMDGIFTY